MCSTGPETTPFARPANDPAKNSCPLDSVAPSGPPRPLRAFCAAKRRFVHSSAPNWIETHRPIPRSGVKVPCNTLRFGGSVGAAGANKHAGISGKARGAPNLVECQRALVLEDPARAVQHALVRASRRGLHPLFPEACVTMPCGLAEGDDAAREDVPLSRCQTAARQAPVGAGREG